MPPLRTWFDNGGALICRPHAKSKARFAAALKGGHNAEHHNHNDVGSFSVVAGATMVICDPGGEVYTARTFSARRYDSTVLSSYGHAVPVVAGQLQRSGAEARAVVVRADFRDEADTLALDLRSAYSVPELQRLERTFRFRRTDPTALIVRDDVASKEPRSFETALITWGPWKRLSETELRIVADGEAVRVKIDAGDAPFQIKPETLNEDVPTPRKPLRLGIALTKPVQSTSVTLTITLEPGTAGAARARAPPRAQHFSCAPAPPGYDYPHVRPIPTTARRGDSASARAESAGRSFCSGCAGNLGSAQPTAEAGASPKPSSCSLTPAPRDSETVRQAGAGRHQADGTRAPDRTDTLPAFAG